MAAPAASNLVGSRTGHVCDAKVWLCGIGVIAVIVTAAFVAIHYHEPSLFTFILLGFGSLVAVLRFVIAVVALWREHTRDAMIRRRRRFQELSVEELAVLMERGDLIGGFQSGQRHLRFFVRRPESSRAVGAASARDIARLPSYCFEERAACIYKTEDMHDPEDVALLASDITGTLEAASGSTRVSVAPLPALADHLPSTPSESAPLPPSCAICLEHYKAGEMISLMPCLHGFHEPCLAQWLGIKASCPVCKATLRELLHNSLAQS